MKVTECRICKSKDLIEYLNLGEHPPSDAFLVPEQFDDEKFYPLAVLFCPTCSLSQLSYVVPMQELYPNEYPYETRMNTQGVEHFGKMADELSERFLKLDDLVVDIGSNDGTLLQGFQKNFMKVVGVEPVGRIAREAVVPTIHAFFGEGAVDIIMNKHGKAKLITATNVFAHIHDLHDVMRNVDRLLADDGIFVIEAPYLPDMICDLSFDQIYHEHLSYLSVKPIRHLIKQYDFKIFEAKWFPIHGGSVQYRIARKSGLPEHEVINELSGGYIEIDRLRQFATEIKGFRGLFRDTIFKIKHQGHSVVGVSAPAKGNTLLNYCFDRNIGSDIFSYITEKSPKKIGKYTPGTHIEVASDEKLFETAPDYAVILAWNWESQIKESLKEYKGTWIVPTPKGLKEFNG